MRIIAGSARGHRIKAPDGSGTRPTTDKIREAMFSILFDKVVDAKVLDIFAGTGAIGIESLSRGAKSAIFIDHNHICCDIIRENLDKTKLKSNATVFCNDSFRAMEMLSKKGEKFDIIFIDPPYFEGYFDKILGCISEKELLEDNGILVVEKHVTVEMEEEHVGFEMFKEKRYGEILLCFYRKV